MSRKLRKFKIADRLDLKICVAMIIILSLAFKCNDVLVSMDLRQYGNPILFYAGGIAGTLLVIKISMLLTKFGGILSDIMNRCGRQSMIILIMHPLFISTLYDILDAAKVNPEIFLTDARIIFLATAAGVLIPVLIAKKYGKLPILKIFS